MDINKVWLSGLAATEPVLTKMPNKTPLCTFMMQVNERFTQRDGRPRVRANYIHVEALGKAAAIMSDKVKRGGRYFVDGYIRHDDSRQVEPVRVRVFAIYKDEGADQALYSDGLRQAVDILKTSRDKEAALKTLEGLVASY